MTDPLEELGALARRRSRAAVSPAVDARGRERLARAASATLESNQRRFLRPWLLAAAAVVVAVVGLELVRSRPLGYEVSAGATSASNYLSAPLDKAADVRFTDGSEIHAEPGTRLRVDETRVAGARVVIERGNAMASIRHGAGTRWEFAAGPFEVFVTGTRFSLAWDPVKEEVDLALFAGSVEIASPLTNGRVAVRSGQRFHASLRDGSVQLDPVAAATASASAAVAAPTTAPSAAVDANAPPSSTEEVTEPGPASTVPSGARRTGPAAPPTQDGERWAALVRRGDFRAVVTAAEARGVAECLATCSADDLRALADAGRYLGLTDLAQNSLLTLRRRFASTAQGSPAAFLLGRLAEAKGRASEAARWYRTYADEAPSGQFAADALAGHMRAVAASQGSAAARTLALEYLRRYPDGVQVEAARKLVDTSH